MSKVSVNSSRLRALLFDTLDDVSKSLNQCIDSIPSFFADLSNEERAELFAFVDKELKLPCSVIASKYNDSANNSDLTRELQLQVLFVLECKRLSANENLEPNGISDHGLSDWISELLGRLSVCISDREAWKTFLNDVVCHRYGSDFGRTLSNVYMNLGLEPPDFLPRDDSQITGTTSPPSDKSADCAHESTQSPVLLHSPRSLRTSLRQSLPRALFFDSVVAAGAPGVLSTKNRSSLSMASCTPTSHASDARIGASGARAHNLPASTTTSTPLTTPQLVLISSSNRSRRKGRTPVKRIPITRTSRRSKMDKTPPTEKLPQSAPTVKRTPRGRSSRATPTSHGSTKSARITKHGRTSKSVKSAAAKLNTSRTSNESENPSSKTSSQSRHRRSVHETPNPERSYPRWERAKLAAAEKTKNKIIIVEESPVKPVESLGSPLRRLRRANSMLMNLYHLEMAESAATTSAAAVSVAATHTPSKSDDLPGSSSETYPDGTCLSRTMSRAERWCRRQLEEELSLSQFTSQPSLHSPSCSERSRNSPVPFFSAGVGTSGLLSVSTDNRVCRHSSNLFANMISPRQTASPSPIQSPVFRIKTPCKNILRANPISNAFTCNPPGSTPLNDATSVLKSPCRALTGSACIPSSSFRDFCPEGLPRDTPKTTPRRKRIVPRRTRHLSAGGTREVVRDSPQVFDEEAMFLGRDEFLNETNTTSSVSVLSPLRALSNDGDDDEGVGVYSSSRKKQRISPMLPNSNHPPPLLRLNSTPKISSLLATGSSPPLSRGKGRPSHHQVLTPVKSFPVEDVFPFLTKPKRSPFAPLHVFNSQVTKDIITGDFLESTTTLSSQSASNVVALRTRLFGNSDTNDTNSRSCENHNSGRHMRSSVQTPVRSPTVDDSRHPWDEASPQISLSPGLRQLRRNVREASPDSRSPVRSRRLQFPPLSASATAPSIRPRRSLFH